MTGEQAGGDGGRACTKITIVHIAIVNFLSLGEKCCNYLLCGGRVFGVQCFTT